MSSAELANWFSAIGSLGAVIAALIGFWIIHRQRLREERNAEEGVAYELMTVLHSMGNHLKTIQEHCETQRNDITVFNGSEEHKFKVLQPLIGLSSEGDLALPTRSTELLIKMDQINVWNNIQLLGARNRSLTKLMLDYLRLWEKMIELTPTPSDFTGNVGHIQAGRQGFLELRPTLVMIDRVVGDVTDQANDTISLLDATLPMLGPAFKKYFGKPFLVISPATSGQ